MQVGDSVNAAFCKYPSNGKHSSLSDLSNCADPQQLLRRSQLLGFLSGTLPRLPADQLRELMEYWTVCFEQPLAATVNELRMATSRWLRQKAEVTTQVDEFFGRLGVKRSDTQEQRSDSHAHNLCSNSHGRNFAQPDFNGSAIFREWIGQLITRPRWTHLTSHRPGTAPARLAEAYRTPCLRRRSLDQPEPETCENRIHDELRQLMICFEPICWISGEPGAGKSTLLQWLVHQLIHQVSWPALLPIVIDLKSHSTHCLRKGYQSLIQYFFESLDIPKESSLGCGQLILDQLPKEPRCVLLLDEWSQCDESIREQVWQEVQALAVHHKVVITSRTGQVPWPTQHAYQLVEFTLGHHASEPEKTKLQDCRLRPTASLCRALSELDQTNWQPTQFVAHMIHCQWDRYNVLAHTADQLKFAHWQVLESIALGMIGKPIAAPEFEAVELERHCELHRIHSRPLLHSRLLARSAREPTCLRFTHDGYWLFFAASAIAHSSASVSNTITPTIAPADAERLQRWTLSQTGAAALAHVANADDRWKRHVISLIDQATNQSDLFGHRLLRFTEAVHVCTSHRSSRRSRFLNSLYQAFQRPCPAEVHQAFAQATQSLQQTSHAIKQSNCSDKDDRFYAHLHQFASTSFADPAIDTLLTSLTGHAWPCGQELLVDILSDASLPDERRQCAWRAVAQQPAKLMAPSLLCWIETLWSGISSHGTRSFNARWKQLERVMSTDQWLIALKILADAGHKMHQPWLRWLAHDAPSIPIRLRALEILGNSIVDTDSEEGRAEGERCLVALFNAIDVANDKETQTSGGDWMRLFERLPETLKESLRVSPLRQSLFDKLNDFIHRPHPSRLLTIHKIAHLLALTYLPTERTIGKRLIQTCMTLSGEIKAQCCSSLRKEIIGVWLAAMCDDDPEVLYEFDFDDEAYRFALERVVWQRGWLLFDDRIVNRFGTVIGTRLLETEDWVNDEFPQAVQQIAQQLPERQRLTFLATAK